jgi:hypothetical protein
MVVWSMEQHMQAVCGFKHYKVVTSQVNSRQHASASGTFILPMWSHAWHHTLAVCVGVVQSGCHTLPMLTVLLVCP